MRCSKARILISASLDGELSAREQAALERHLSSCADCSMTKAGLASVSAAMSEWSDEEPSEWLAESFAYKLGKLTEEKTAVAPRRWVWGTATAGLATVLVAVMLIVHSRVEPPVPVAESPVQQSVQEPRSMNPDTDGDSPRPNATPPVAAARPIQTPSRVRAGDSVQSRPVARQPIVRHAAPRKNVVASAAASRPVVAPNGRDTMASRSMGVSEAERLIMQKMALTRTAENGVAVQVEDNLGETGLAVNETIERVRGTLQKAVDLMVVAEMPSNADDNDGGGIL